jgi:V/A-type H+-transporting ATPase subunit D
VEEQVSATRTELLVKREQIALAEQGRDLLKEKRNALMKELMRVADTVLRGSDVLERVASDARYALARAQAIDGPEAVQSAAFATQGEVTLEIEGTYVMGVPVPLIEPRPVARDVLERGYSPTGASGRIDEAAARFEEEVELIIELAAREARLRRLADEVQRTSRRVNALEHILIPRLKVQRDRIQMALEEREREDHFRLKRVKQKLVSHQPAPGSRERCSHRRRPE